jgi:multidrug efflux pump subunit AcrA (membrane-fusion protein)
MTNELSEQLDLEIKQLERDKKLAEIQQIRSNARSKWITPAFVLGILPVFAALGLWLINEMKQYSDGHRALAEVNHLATERKDLERQKTDLNIEIMKLLAQKDASAKQLEKQEQEVRSRQEQIDKAYLSAKFATGELGYALGHLKGLGRPSKDGLGAELASVRDDVRAKIVQDYDLVHTILDVSDGLLKDANAAVRSIPAVDWAIKFEGTPTGSILPGRRILVAEEKAGPIYYDVDNGRLLNPQELGSLQGNR